MSTAIPVEQNEYSDFENPEDNKEFTNIIPEETLELYLAGVKLAHSGYLDRGRILMNLTEKALEKLGAVYLWSGDTSDGVMISICGFPTNNIPTKQEELDNPKPDVNDYKIFSDIALHRAQNSDDFGDSDLNTVIASATLSQIPNSFKLVVKKGGSNEEILFIVAKGDIPNSD